MSEKEGRRLMRIDHEGVGTAVVAILLLFEAFSVWFLWTFDSVGPEGETTFALFLAADLVSFTMISYIYRLLKRENRFGTWPLLAGCVFIVALLFAALALA